MQTTTELKTRAASLRAEKPKLRARDMARELGVSEAELVASRTGEGVTRLRPDGKALLEGLGALGTVMALTRNEHAVIEKDGQYRNLEFFQHSGNVLDEGIDLRFFLAHWNRVFAVEENGRRSIQVFDKSGTAVHKVYLRSESDQDAYDALVRQMRSDDQGQGEAVEAYPEPKPDRPDSEIDVAQLRERWGQLQDTHDFYFMLRDLGVGRTQALRLGGQWSRKVPTSSLETALDKARAAGLDIMVFVGNRGNIEIHTGPVNKLARVGDWTNVLDPGFNLHVDTRGIASAWVVRKTCSDGEVTSLEMYDATGSNICLLFGRRKPGQKEQEGWRGLLASI